MRGQENLKQAKRKLQPFPKILSIQFKPSHDFITLEMNQAQTMEFERQHRIQFYRAGAVNNPAESIGQLWMLFQIPEVAAQVVAVNTSFRWGNL